MQTVRIKKTKIFDKNLAAYNSGKFRLIGNQGSTRSSKTYSLCQLLSLWIPVKQKKRISIVSPSLPHLKKGARRDFLEILESAMVYDDNAFNKTDNIYTYPNGSEVEFFGADESGRLRGPGRDILYINEANLLGHDSYLQLALRTTGTVFLDFNPIDESCWVYDEVDKTGNLMVHSTYKDNPFLTRGQIEEIESLKLGDPNLWNVYGLGLRGASAELIYTHWKITDKLPDKGEVIYGLDFGYNVPSALVKIEIHEGAIWVDEMLYETKLTTDDLIERLKVKLGKSRGREIFADAAEPKTIESIYRAGYNIKPADKDVTEGIKKVKSMPLYITSRSTNVIKEIKSYKWKTDKNGKIIDDEPTKYMDHGMDAIRYAVFTKLSRPGFYLSGL